MQNQDTCLRTPPDPVEEAAHWSDLSTNEAYWDELDEQEYYTVREHNPDAPCGEQA